MAKSKKVVSKNVVAPVEAAMESVLVEAVVAPAPAEAPTTPVPAKINKAKKAERPPVDPATEAHARWKRRLGRWQAKAQAAGVDAKALMTEALAA